MADVLAALAIGAGATLGMDLWNLFLRKAFGMPSLDYRLLGRWVRHMPEGRLRHASIAAAPGKAHERAVGWLTHYAIGIGLAAAFVALVGSSWLSQPTVLPALGYGVVTVVFPLFVLQPALGLGIASSRAPRPARARLKSLATHAVFGLGLYLCALGLGLIRDAA
ncbi:MAG TPA: DUF2938 domain-containing protein [Candidatus Polarisedimenticolaceae bacterium]|nr:DUF2938 domain-containing protein [Candidatus Polarisedimenticolaceae bacterium]